MNDKTMNPKRFDQLPKEELKALGRKAGIASGEARKRKKAIKETLEIFLSMPVKKGKVSKIEDIKNFMELKGKNITVDEAINLQLVQMALKGNLNAIDMIYTVIGEKPNKNVNINANVTKNPISDLTTEELRKLINQNDGKE